MCSGWWRGKKQKQKPTFHPVVQHQKTFSLSGSPIAQQLHLSSQVHTHPFTHTKFHFGKTVTGQWPVAHKTEEVAVIIPAILSAKTPALTGLTRLHQEVCRYPLTEDTGKKCASPARQILAMNPEPSPMLSDSKRQCSCQTRDFRHMLNGACSSALSKLQLLTLLPPIRHFRFA